MNTYAHFSFDDCLFWVDLIGGQLASAFDQPFLAQLQTLHARYGATFTLNLFMTDGVHRLNAVPSLYAAEFAAQRDWLRFAFHAEDTNTHYDADCPDAIAADYREFTDAILRMTGTPDCIDRVTRLGFFSGSSANVDALRKSDFGLLGLFSADDTRVSYCLSPESSAYVYQHGQYFSADHRLLFIKSQLRIERCDDVSDFLPLLQSAPYPLEFFTHEQEWTPVVSARTESLLALLCRQGLPFSFVQDHL